MIINTYHNYYDSNHLSKVTEEMRLRGAPIIRCIWSGIHCEWMAIEGSHRLRAAHALGLTPIIRDVSNQRQVRMQSDGESVRRSVRALAQELEDGLWQAHAIEFK